MIITARSVARRALTVVGLVVAFSVPAPCQVVTPPDEAVVQPVKLSGPRFGVTVLSDGVVRVLDEDFSIDVSPVISQFGWQFEKRFSTQPSGFTAVSEWVVLVGGLEQGQFLPSVNWLVGMRTAGGVEFGVGPNLTAAGFALAVAAGVTMRKGNLNIPVNLAVVPSKDGVRVSLLTGFNMRR